ncbi:hypothetical protein N7519_008434 [Penicillium mononematosum]|uniref:uncharacterized protein n=1 Tax=Penicillium mononematosum TaxID=268346 RepID=UPI00254761E8|nr:uncharacterized protein N7519_008434 [Penicillium mononematosum]KAJ6177973.1 hypothetical protein N7519_008434 [Penicillium mononematosum]
MSFTSVQNGRVTDSRSLTPIRSAPPVKEKEPPDPNKADPRLTINRALIYERQLPGDAYITAHVQRLQHGYYSSDTVSDEDAEHVDFLAIAFTFHSPHTTTHRIKSATISVSVHGNRDLSSSKSYPYGHPPGNPRFLMHAPHLIYGSVSPETMEWTFSLAGSLGISEMPVSASVISSGSLNGRYKRYEMMRIQGSARTLKNPAGREFDVEAGKIVWSMEENNVQRSGLPREFTFVMLVQKPSANSKISLSIDVDPVIDAMIGSYPSLLLKLPEYQPLKRRGVNFQQEVGQRFEPVNPVRGFNFAELGSMFDEYIAMPGRKFSRQIQIPAETGIPEDHFQGTYPGQYGSLNPIPYQQQLQNSLSLQNSLLQTTLQNLWTIQPRREETHSRPQQVSSQTQNQNQSQSHYSPKTPHPHPHPHPHSAPTTPSRIPPTAAISIPLNLHLHLDPATTTHLTNLAHIRQAPSPLSPRRTPSLRRTQAREFPSTHVASGTSNTSTTSSPSLTESIVPHTDARPQQRSHTLSEIAEGDGPDAGPDEEEEDRALLHLSKKPVHTPGTPRRVARRDPVGGARGHRRGMSGVNSKTQAAVSRSIPRS